MGAGGVHALYRAADTPVHRLPAEVKIAATLAYVLAVVLTPPQAFWAFAVHAAVLLVLVALARIPPLLLLRRMSVEIPFVVFALLIPLLAGGQTVEVLGLELSEPGLVQAWNILAKATLGVGASALLATTTEVPDLLLGLQRLRMPPVFVSIISFMVRYADVIVAEAQRMRVARLSRGYNPRAIWEAKALASSVGVLFVRSYERGERVYLAMVSRGYDGAIPQLHPVGSARAGQWAGAMAAPAIAAIVMGAAWASL